MSQPPLTPDEITTVGDIIVNILLFVGGWITRLLQTRKNKRQ